MAKVLRHSYRWSERGEDGSITRNVATPGTKVSELPKEVQEQVKNNRRLTVDERRFDADNNNIIPLSALEDTEAEEEVLPRYTPVRTPQSQIGSNLSEEERTKQAAQLAQGNPNESNESSDDDDSKKASKSNDKK